MKPLAITLAGLALALSIFIPAHRAGAQDATPTPGLDNEPVSTVVPAAENNFAYQKAP